MGSKTSSKDRYAIAAVSVTLLIAVACMGHFLPAPSDFLSFYTGARLVGTPHLYSRAYARTIQEPITGLDRIQAYVRPPFYAAACWPLGRMPYRTAFAIWQCCNVAALIGFAFLWKPGILPLLIACWFPPLWWNLMIGQDIPLILLSLAVALRLYEKDRKVLAGLVFALCGAKFHMFLLAPVAILVKRAWSFGAGLAVGGVILFGLSAAVAGWDWPAKNLEAVRLVDQLEGPQGFMPKLGGDAPVSVGAGLLAAAVVLVVLGMTLVASLRGSFRNAMAVAVCGSLVISFHAFVYDWGLLQPILLSIAQRITPGRAMTLSAFAGVAGLAVRFGPTSWFGQFFPLFLIAVVLHVACRPMPDAIATPADKHGPGQEAAASPREAAATSFPAGNSAIE